MSQARLLANLIDSSGDIVSAALDNVPPSNDASALTTGTLDAARIAAGSLATSKITGLHAVATSGDYNNLTNQPTILTQNQAQQGLMQSPTIHHTSTSSNRALSGSFVNHLSISYTIPSGFKGLAFMSAHFSSMYEGNSGGAECRFHIAGPNNVYTPVHRFGRGAFNNYQSADSFTYFQPNLNAGTHTVYTQVRTWQGNVTLNEDGGYDNMSVLFLIDRD